MENQKYYNKLTQNVKITKEDINIGNFEDKDYEEFANMFNSILQDHKRKNKRLDTILKQSDNQQKRLIQLTEELNQHKFQLEERVKTEVEKNHQQELLMFHQSKQAQMGEMLSMIAHQWRQPLSAISATSNALKLKASLNKIENNTVIELTDKISKYAQHLSKTIDDFRDFFKIDKEKKVTSFNELVESSLSIIETSLNSNNITITKDLQSTNVFYTYPNEIMQVILNIIKNAEDVLIENKTMNPNIMITTNDNILIISDNGGGIKNDILDKIFAPYFSTKLDKNGTGLGLYMSKKIIEDHCKGEITVSNDDFGAVFRIKIENLI